MSILLGEPLTIMIDSGAWAHNSYLRRGSGSLMVRREAALLSAIPVPDPKVERHRKLIQLEGEIPSPINPPSGCRFHTRCPIAQSICSEVEPPLERKAPRHWSACHFSDQVGSVAPWARG